MKLTLERRDELEQWVRLGKSPTQLARTYGVSAMMIYRIRRRLGIKSGPVGRYPRVPAETVEEILTELRRDASKGRRAAMARRFGLDLSTVSRIAAASGLPKMPGRGRPAKCVD